MMSSPIYKLPGRVRARLTRHLGQVDVIEHGDVHNCLQVSHQLNIPLGQIAKGVLWDTTIAGTKWFLFTVVPADKRVSVTTLAETMGFKKLTLARDPRQATGYAAGSIPPFALPPTVIILVDEGVARQPRVWFGSGVPNISLAGPGMVLVELGDAKIAGLT